MAKTNRLTIGNRRNAASCKKHLETNFAVLVQLVKETEREADQNSTGSSAACSTSHSAACSKGVPEG